MTPTKKELRAQMRRLKQLVSDDNKREQSVAVFSMLETLPQFDAAKTILLYHSLPDELPTHEVLSRWALKKEVYLPRVVGDDLEIVRYEGSLSDDNAFHIEEPTGDALISPSMLDLIVVPGVAFDRCGNRMGRGKGYYDRLLTDATAYKVGVCMDFQLVDEVPTEPHDRPMDCVIAPQGMFFV